MHLHIVECSQKKFTITVKKGLLPVLHLHTCLSSHLNALLHNLRFQFLLLVLQKALFVFSKLLFYNVSVFVGALSVERKGKVREK